MRNYLRRSVLTCDGELIRRVLENLIHNALKFTPEDGSIHVAVSRIGDALRIEVRDTGPGIPPSIEQRSLIKFWQATPKSKAHSSGLGWPFAV
jgi:signal transduction histidine kinase